MRNTIDNGVTKGEGLNSRTVWLATLLVGISVLLTAWWSSVSRTPSALTARTSHHEEEAPTARAALPPVELNAAARSSGHATSSVGGQNPSRSKLLMAASVRGRVVVGDAPVAGLHVQISHEMTAERTEEHAKFIEGIENQEVKDLFVRSEPGTYSRVWGDGVGHNTTDEDGEFSCESLPLGNYLLSVLLAATPANQGDRNMPTYSSAFQLTPGLDLDLGDIAFYEGTVAEYRDEVAHLHAPATLRIETGEPGLSIHIGIEGSGLLNMEATSDSEGVAIVELRESRLARIDVTGKHGDMMASTEGHHLYPKDRETLVQLPATPGALSITLPEGESLIDGVSVQFVLVRSSPGRPFAYTKTVHGARPVTRDRRARTTAQGIEYESLRTGRYLVRAVGKYRLANGGLLPSGKEWRAEVQVVPGKVTMTFPQESGHPTSAFAQGCSHVEKETTQVHRRTES